MTDLRHQRLGIAFFHKLEALARESGVEKVETIFDDMLITYAKVDAAFETTGADRQQELDELFQLQELVDTEFHSISRDITNADHDLPVGLTRHKYVEDALELYRLAVAAAMVGQRIGLVPDDPAFMGLLPGPLTEISDEVKDRQSKTLRNRVSLHRDLAASNTNTVPAAAPLPT